jgi:hypothetical protein
MGETKNNPLLHGRDFNSFYTFVVQLKNTLMPKALIFLFSFLFVLPVTHAQNMIDQDAVLKNLRNQLPEGWVLEIKDKRIIFSRKDSIWTKHVNHNNQLMNAAAKKMNADERVASFKKEGRKAKAMISFRTEPRWSAQSTKKAEEQNKKAFGQIAKLPEKYKIEALYDSVLSEKGGEQYTPKTDADRAQIKKFADERDKLLKSIIQVPFLQTEHYSLFPDLSSGVEDASTDVYPEQASTELYKVQNMVNDICRIQKQP